MKKEHKTIAKITAVLQALQMSREIKQLCKYEIIEPRFSYSLGSYGFTKRGTELRTWCTDKHLSCSEYVPVNFWTNLIGTAGDYATIHKNWTVELYNSGILASEYVGQHTYTGLPARIIYNKMRRMYKKHKQATRQR